MQSIPSPDVRAGSRWHGPFRTLAMGPLLWLVVACGSTEPEVLTASAPETFVPEVVVETPEIIEAEYEDARLQEGVALSVAVAEEIEAPAVEVETPPTLASFMLRRGETLAHFARWSEVPVEDIADYSSLSLDGSYPVGTEVQLPIEGDALAAFEARRAEHQTARVEQYLASRGGALEQETYRVRTGDSAWGIARQAGGIPVWLLESYNPEVDLEALHPGDELTLPVLADVVVDAEDPSGVTP